VFGTVRLFPMPLELVEPIMHIAAGAKKTGS